MVKICRVNQYFGVT